VKVGAFYWATEYAARVTGVAKMAEAAGCESFWVPEHTHVPLSTASRRPSARAGEAPEEMEREFRHMLDPFVALAAVASVTTTIKLGTAICMVPVRDPIITAKAVATLDQLSDGRVLFGVGAGWIEEELSDHGIDPAQRWRLLREHVEAMKELWTSEEPQYKGTHVNFGRCACYPKPVQKPHPPILVGMHGPRALQHVVRWGDEWLPGIGRIEERVAELQQRAADAGRPPDPGVVHQHRDPRPRLGRPAAQYRRASAAGQDSSG
jgi:probable F420-dependent oxidoreductase